MVLTWSGLVVLMSMFLTIPLTAIFVEDLKIKETEAVWIGSIYSLCFALGCLIYGPLSDKYGRRIFLVTSITVLSIVTFITGFVQGFELLLIMRGIQGFAAAGFAPISLVYTSHLFPIEKRLAVTGYITSGFLMASIIAQVFSIVINERYGWSAIFIVLGIIYFVTAFMIIKFLPNEPYIKQEISIISSYLKFKTVFKNKDLLKSFYIMFTVYFSLIGMYTILGGFLTLYGFTENAIFLVRAIAIFSILTAVFAGKISNKFGTFFSLRSALILSTISLFFMGVSTSTNLIILASLLFVAGIAYVVPVNVSLVVRNAGENKGGAVLFNAFMLFLGASVGPVIATNLTQSGSYFLSYSVLSSFLLISFLLSLSIKSPKEV